METKILTSMEEAKEIDNGIVYDIDEGVQYLEEFNRKTTRFEKQFKKLGKKQNGRNPNQQKKLVYKFVEENLLPFWKTEVEQKFWKFKEMEFLEKDIIYTYIFGAFVTGHSKGLQQHMRTAFANILKEMTDRAIAAKEKKDYQEMRMKAIQENMKNLSPEEKTIIESNINMSVKNV